MTEQDPNTTDSSPEDPAADPKTVVFIKRSLSRQPDLVIEYPAEPDPGDTKLAC